MNKTIQRRRLRLRSLGEQKENKCGEVAHTSEKNKSFGAVDLGVSLPQTQVFYHQMGMVLAPTLYRLED
jgi:hypothetical protein